jgi:hypothetical protein
MLKRTLVRVCAGDCVFRRFEHPTRGTVDTLSYPCGRLVYVAKGFKPAKLRKKSVGQRAIHKRIGAMWATGKKAAGGDA